MFRELIFDTETTGLYENKGDRIIEIGLLEVVDMNLTGRQFHCYLNPEGRKSNPFAQKVHGIGHEFLQDKPLFQSIADELLAFIGSDRLVAHNAQFDLRFLNKELQRIGRGNIPMSQSICTKDLASQHFGKGSLSLDKLCEHFGVDRQTRDQAHGALLDCHLLYQVYYKLRSIGGVEN